MNGDGHRRLAAAGVLAAGLLVVAALGASAMSPSNAATASLPAAGTCSVAPGTWPEYQGDPTHDADACSGLNTANVNLLRPAWFVGTKGVVSDTPAVAFGTVYAGDYSGLFYAIDQRTGREEWTFDTSAAQGCFLDAAVPHADTHSAAFGRIPASPAAATIAGRPTVFAAAGGSLFALDAATGQCLWAEDTDPGAPTNPVEIESSPVIDTSTVPPEVLVGNDDNSSSGIAVTGLMAFDAVTGGLLWKYEPERDLTLTPGQFGGSAGLTLSCGDGAAKPYCTPGAIADLAPPDPANADGCGDVWSSPALDQAFVDPAGANSYEGSAPAAPAGWSPKTITAGGAASPDGLVVFGTGNCAAKPHPSTALAHGDYVDNQGVFALDPVTGIRVWNFVEPYNAYDNNASEPGGGDDDFGSSPLIADLPAGSVDHRACPPTAGSGRTALVVEGSKSGYAYGLCAANGTEVWATQAAQPGQASADLVGAVGGYIGSPSLGESNGHPTVFLTSAIPTPFANDGIRELGDGDSNISSCPGLEQLPLLPVCPDLTLLQNPARVVALHALNAATGAVEFQAPSLPTYAASTYTNGVVFLPDSLAGSVMAFDANRGLPIWAFPIGAIPASAAAIVGQSIVFGTGETESTLSGETVPPQLTGIWSFSTNPAEFTITPPGVP